MFLWAVQNKFEGCVQVVRAKVPTVELTKVRSKNGPSIDLEKILTFHPIVRDFFKKIPHFSVLSFCEYHCS